ncbi:hypothetical protein CHARACLAT_030995, partial [Characodon lateralis]|nr:hypothetical protein [Characodon lateralis]
MKKSWDCRTVISEIKEAFKDKIPDDFSIERLMPCGNKLVSLTLRQGQELNGFMIHKIFKSKSVYIRPSTNLPLMFDGTDSEDSFMEADAPSATTGHTIASQMSYHMNTKARGNQTSLIQ